MKKKVYFFAVMAALLLLSACRPKTGPDIVAFKDLVANPSRYDGKFVCTSGAYLSGFEASGLAADTLERGGRTYLTEPVVWVERVEFTDRTSCANVDPQGSGGEVCRVTICGTFDYCRGCGHLNGYQFQLRGEQPALVKTPTSVAGPPVLVETPQPAPTSTPEPIPTIAVPVSDQPGPSYELVFSIPVNETGVAYRGLGVPELDVSGPPAFVVLPDGSFVIADVYNNRLLRYDAAGTLLASLVLDEIGITNVSDLQYASGSMFLTEISFYVPGSRYRINRLSLDGELLAFYDIPVDFRLADNLPGILVDGDGRLLLDMEGMGPSPEFRGKPPGIITLLVDAQGTWAPVAAEGRSYYGRIFRLDYSRRGSPAVIGGGVRAETKVTMGMGSLQILGALPDGRFYIIREDVVSDAPSFLVDVTVHFLSAEGKQLGAARFPLIERVYHVDRGLALGPDGIVYALLAREKTLDVLRLNLHTRLDPLVLGAAEPVVSAP